MDENLKPKINRPRLKSMQSLYATSLAAIDELMKDKSMKSAKLADLAIARLNCIQSMMLQRSEDAKAKLRFADTDKLLKENARLKAENDKLRAEVNSKAPKAPVTNCDAGTFRDGEDSFEARLAKRLGTEGGRT